MRAAAEAQPARGHATDGPALKGEGEFIQPTLLGSDRHHALGHADAEVDDAAGRNLAQHAARDDFSLRERHRRRRNPAAGLHVTRVKRLGKGLVVLAGLGDNEGINEHAGHAHGVGRGGTISDFLHLRNHQAAVIARGLRNGQHFTNETLAFHGEIARAIGARCPDEADVDGEGAVMQPVLAAKLHALNQWLGGATVQAPAAMHRIDKGVQADPGQDPGAMRGDVTKELADDALRETIRLDIAGERKLTKAWRKVPMAADDAP